MNEIQLRVADVIAIITVSVSLFVIWRDTNNTKATLQKEVTDRAQDILEVHKNLETRVRVLEERDKLRSKLRL